MKTKINVLGVDYELHLIDSRDSYMLKNDCDGYCDNYRHLIKVLITGNQKFTDEIVKHELLHAFLYESGIDLGYGIHSEENVNWFSLQFNKIRKAVEEYEKEYKKYE